MRGVNTGWFSIPNCTNIYQYIAGRLRDTATPHYVVQTCLQVTFKNYEQRNSETCAATFSGSNIKNAAS